MPRAMRYRPLDVERDEVRLLTIQAAEEDSSEVLRCDLEHYSLNEYTSEYREFVSKLPRDTTWSKTFPIWKGVCLQKIGLPNEPIPDDEEGPEIDILFRYTWGDYTAVSYAWGEDTHSENIVLNGEQFHVTHNLYTALIEHRSAGHFGRNFKLWIDAICINQNEISERNAQIKRMRSIYGQALLVFGWLGPENDNSEVAIEILRTMDLALERPGYLQTDGFYTPDFSTSYQELLDSFEPWEWLALFNFCDRPYWKRLWILQEISASPSTTHFKCGSSEISFGVLCRAFNVLALDTDKVLDIVSKALKASGHENDPSPAFGRVEAVANLSRTIAPARLFHHVLKLIRSSEQSILQDKVYGVMGLIGDKITNHITPDYTLTASAVYIDLARAAISGTCSLDILAHKEMSPQTQLSLPSWVPDWTVRFKQMPLLAWNSYQASGTSVIPEQVFDSEANLLCKGIIDDTVCGLGATETNAAIIQTTFESCAYKSIADCEFALWMNLVTGSDSGCKDSASTAHMRLSSLPWEPDSEFHKLNASNSYKELHSYRLANKSFRIFDHQLSDLFPELPLSAELKVEYSTHSMLYAHKLQEFVSVISRNLRGRTLMTTKNGYLGLAPSSVVQGDVIAILLGCRWPVALRPSGRFYQVVGVCYIHDLMQGEMMEGLNDGRFRLEDITLC